MRAVAVEREATPEWFLDSLVTGVCDRDGFERAFDGDETTLKTAAQIQDYEER